MNPLLDPVKTAPFLLGEQPPDVVLWHGFTGTPWDIRPLGDALFAAGFSVRAERLPGHATTPEDMAKVTASDWQHAVDQALASAGRPVFLAGLSMGALLSICAAARHPEQVLAVAALAPAMEFEDPLFRLVSATRAFAAVEAIRPWIRKDGTDLTNAAARAEAPVLARYPSARLRDLVAVRDEARRTMADVRCPVLLLAAENDHVVSLSGVRELARGLRRAAGVQLLRLARGAHIVPRDDGGAAAADQVAAFFRSVQRSSCMPNSTTRPGGIPK